MPDEFRVNVDEVYLKRTPKGFLVMSRDPWEVFFDGVEELSDGFFHAARRRAFSGKSQPWIVSATMTVIPF